MKRNLITSFLFAVAALYSQPHGSSAFPATGQLPTGVYSYSDVEKIDMVNGNLSFAIPLAQLPPDRNGQPFQFSIVYNSKLWESRNVGTPGAPAEQLEARPNGGWRYGGRYDLEQTTQAWTSTQCTINDAFVNQLRLVLPDGSKRVLRLWNESDGNRSGYYPVAVDGKNSFNEFCPNTQLWASSPVVWYTNDGSYIRVEVDVDQNDNPLDNTYRVYLPNGTVVAGTVATASPQTITDRNGVVLTVNNVALAPPPVGPIVPTTFIDANGRTLQITYDNGTTGFDSVSYNNATWQVYWDRSTRTTPNYTYSSTGTATAYMPPTVTKIVLPVAQKEYLFTYTAKWGEVSKLTLPTVNTPAATAKTELLYEFDLDGSTVTPGACGIVNNKIKKKTEKTSYIFDGALKTKPNDDVWTYDFQYNQSTQTAPDSGKTTTHFFPVPGACASGNPYDLKAGLVFQTVHPDGRVVDQIWRENTPYDSVAGNRFGNLMPEYEITTFTSAGSPESADPSYAVRNEYDRNGNLLSRQELAATSYGQIVRESSGEATGLTGTPTAERSVVSTYAGAAPSWNSTLANHASLYNRPSTFSRATLLTTRTSGTSGPGSYRELEYDNPLTTANVLVDRQWDSRYGITTPLTDSNSVVTRFAYDSALNNLVTQITDARGKVTKVEYNNSTCGRPLYPFRVVDGYGLTGSARTTELQYDCNTGQITSKLDVENGTKEESTYDNFGRRRTLTQGANGAGLKRKTAWSYDDAGRKVVTRRDLNSFDDGLLVEATHYDTMGRARLQRKSENGVGTFPDNESEGIKVQYEHFYNATWASNPYRAATSLAAATSEIATMGWTVQERDTAGRPSASRKVGRLSSDPNTDVAMGLISLSYNRLQTTKMENAVPNRVTRYERDGWGKLTAVVEAPGSSEIRTSYGYDSLGNLTGVAKAATAEPSLVETRSFAYDSMGRLIEANNPETGRICYGLIDANVCSPRYDGLGNLLRRQDARNAVTTMSYDPMGRIESKSYSGFGCDGASTDCLGTVSYEYDTAGIAYDRGQLTAVRNNEAEHVFLTFDALGRVTSSRQKMGTANYDFGLYDYNLAGGLRRKNLPSGKALVYGRDLANRETSVGLEVGGVLNTAATVTGFTAAGAISDLTFGNQATETWTFNPRSQVTAIHVNRGGTQLLGLTYAYGTTLNDGNPQSQLIQPLNVTQTYTYDVFHRLQRVDESGAGAWYQQMGYDQFANRWVDSQSTALPSDGFRPNSVNFFRVDGALNGNRFSSVGNDVQYDAAGNLQRAGAGLTLVYDAENRIMRDTNSTVAYGYDGNGRRVRRQANGRTRTFVYDAFGELAAEYGGDPGLGRQYLHPDALGSTRLVLDGSGAVLERMDYLPFGEELQGTATKPNPNGRTSALGYKELTNAQKNPAERFTTKERDAETGLDYFAARYLSATQGRFTSPDVPFTDQAVDDPQSWNLYSYVRNSPLSLIDPTGQCSKKGGSSQATDDPDEPCVAPGSTSVTVVLNDSLDPLEVLSGFATGRLPQVMTFSEDSKLSLELLKSRHVQNLLRSLQAEFNSCGNPIAGSHPRSLGSWPLLKRVARMGGDGVNFVTRGATGNLTASILGSYNLSYSITDVNQDKGSATVDMVATNPMTFASAFRDPLTMEDAETPAAISMTGVMRNVDMTMRMRAQIRFNNTGCPVK